MASHLTQNRSRGLPLLPWSAGPCVNHSRPHYLWFHIQYDISACSVFSRHSILHFPPLYRARLCLRASALVSSCLNALLLGTQLAHTVTSSGLCSNLSSERSELWELCKQHPTTISLPYLALFFLYLLPHNMLCILFIGCLPLEWRFCVTESDKYLVSERIFTYKNIYKENSKIL